MAHRQVRAADAAVRKAVVASRADGLFRAEIAAIVGVSVSRIADILKASGGS
ncbi:hypothetical protein ACWGR4_35665 [Embleya sp. NPDC055664]